MRHRRMPLYSPSTDTLGLEIWLDASDSSTSSLKNTGGTAITNGATVGTWSSKAGTARNFTQWGANGRPTWNTGIINGLPAVLFNSQILTNQVQTHMQSMPGLTIMSVQKRVTTAGSSIGLTTLDSGTGKHDIALALAGCNSTWNAGGIRTDGQTFSNVIGNTTPSATYIQTAVFDYSAATLRIYESGVEGKQVAFQNTGTTPATEPYAISVGGFAQESASAFANAINAYVAMLLIWPSALSPDQLVGPHTYARLNWGIN